MGALRSWVWIGLLVLVTMCGLAGATGWIAIPIGAAARMLIRNFSPEEREADRMHQTSPAISMAVSLGMGILESWRGRFFPVQPWESWCGAELPHGRWRRCFSSRRQSRQRGFPFHHPHIMIGHG
jgi:hypothetical protein